MTLAGVVPRPVSVLWLLCLILAGATVYFALITLFQRWLPDYRPLKGITKALKVGK